MNRDNWVTMKQAAERLGVPYTTLVRWVQSGRVQSRWFGDVRAIPEAEVERLKAEGRPKVGLPKGTRLSRSYEGTCQACGQPFQASRPAKFCSTKCSARYRARERAAARKASR